MRMRWSLINTYEVNFNNTNEVFEREMKRCESGESCLDGGWSCDCICEAFCVRSCFGEIVGTDADRGTKMGALTLTAGAGVWLSSASSLNS